MMMVPMFLKKMPFVFMLYPVSNTIAGSSSSVHDLASNTAVYHSHSSINPTADIPEPMYRINTPAMIPKMTTTPLWLRRWTSQCSSHVPTMNEKAIHSSVSVRYSAKYSVGGNGGTADKPLWHGVDGETVVGEVGELGVADIHDLSVLQVNSVCLPNVDVHNLQLDRQSVAVSGRKEIGPDCP